jgi:PqqD family protein of HPr-rel-A system
MPSDPPMSEERFVAIAGLKSIDYDEESVVFSDSTWQTHVLNTAAAEVLAMTAAAPRTVDEIAQALAAWLNASETHNSREHAARLLGELHALGLIVPLAKRASR